ncbi:MAG TPA: hypothetical protein G4N92_01120 [Anaerolineae bacterium]|nr:hypothetical protein [Anaerolineae bacterium]
MLINVFVYLLIAIAIIVPSYVLISSNLRLSLASLAVQYLVVFVTIIQVWPLPLSAVLLVSGWMAVAVIGSMNSPDSISQERGRSEIIFRLFSSLLICTFIFTLSPQIKLWLPIPDSFILIGLIFFCIGLLQTGMSSEPIKIIIGLLTLLSGFEVVYAALEGSALVTGFLAAIHLSIATIGSILAAQATSGEML